MPLYTVPLPAPFFNLHPVKNYDKKNNITVYLFLHDCRRSICTTCTR